MIRFVILSIAKDHVACNALSHSPSRLFTARSFASLRMTAVANVYPERGRKKRGTKRENVVMTGGFSGAMSSNGLVVALATRRIAGDVVGRDGAWCAQAGALSAFEGANAPCSNHCNSGSHCSRSAAVTLAACQKCLSRFPPLVHKSASRAGCTAKAN